MFKRISLAVCLTICALSAHSAEINPLASTYDANHKSGVLTVSNTNDRAEDYQVFVDKWVVIDGKQTLVPSKEIRFAPSTFTVQPGDTQTLRYVYTGPKGESEGAYRIRVEQIPTEIVAVKSGVDYNYKYSFPWFWRTDAMAPKLSARWDGGTLVLTNTGTATAQLVNLATGSVSKEGLVGYVLPGETARFELDAKSAGTVSLDVNGEATTLDPQ